MRRLRRTVAAAAAMTLAYPASTFANEAQTALAFYGQEQATTKTETSPQKAAEQPDGDITGSIGKQIASVSVKCLKPELMRIVRGASSHFGTEAVITSGYRPGRRSYHGRCMAADVQIRGVASGTLARYFRAQAGVGGVGTYGHTRSVHVDIAPRQYTWHHGRRKRYAALGSGGCPCCAGLAYGVERSAEAASACAASRNFAAVRLGAARG